MKTSYLKKVAALLCSATTLLALGATLSANAADDAVFYGAQVVAEPGQKEVPFTLSIENNPGYAASGVKLTYDSRLTVVTNDDGSVKKKGGPAYQDLSCSVKLNVEDSIIGWGTMGSDLNRENDVIVTFYFDVPDTAQPGDKFMIQVQGDQLADAHAHDFPYTSVDGWIEIAGVTTTTTTATTTTTTSTSSAPASSDTTTTTTTIVSDTTTTTSGAGTQTGDAGVALAVAGLLTAVGTAVVVRRKRS